MTEASKLNKQLAYPAFESLDVTRHERAANVHAGRNDVTPALEDFGERK